MKRLGFYLFFPLLGACSWVGHVAKSSVEGAASFYGLDRFTLAGEVPENFRFVAKIRYAPKNGQECKVYSPGLGGYVSRTHQYSQETEASTEKQIFNFKIPINYYVPGCPMEIVGVAYELNGTYGPDPWDRGRDSAGGLSIRDSLPASVEPFPNTGVKEHRGKCIWFFQISAAIAKKDQIEKMLSCFAADENWNVPEDRFERRKPGAVVSREALAGKMIVANFRLSEAEEPATGDTWIKTLSGWKRCLGKGPDDSYGFCRGNTTDFRTFKSGAEVCTVYPGCRE